jgi:replicative DNA helicase
MLDRGNFRTVFFKPTFRLARGKTSPIADILREYGIWDIRCKQKFIPDKMFYMSHKNTAVLLRALFSGDGTVFLSGNDKNHRSGLQISYSSASDKLIEGVQQLLLKIGIVSFVTKLKNKKGQCWNNLYIPGKANIEMFIDKVGFINKRKNDILLNGWDLTKDKKAGWTTYSYNKERTICFIPIKSITSIGNQEVYDIEVDSVHNFVANNIIVHNSIEQDSDMVIFIYRQSYYFKDEELEIKGINPDESELLVEKHRNGVTGAVQTRFIKALMRFEDFYQEQDIGDIPTNIDDKQELPF